jgi:hypothetical protein
MVAAARTRLSGSSIHGRVLSPQSRKYLLRTILHRVAACGSMSSPIYSRVATALMLHRLLAAMAICVRQSGNAVGLWEIVARLQMAYAARMDAFNSRTRGCLTLTTCLSSDGRFCPEDWSCCGNQGYCYPKKDFHCCSYVLPKTLSNFLSH